MLLGMMRALKSKISIPVGIFLVVVLLSGCTTFNPVGRSGMMNSSSRYYSPKLTCALPQNLPGRVINVALGDMGMTRMMGGVAPRNSRMRLVALPSTIATGEVSVLVTNLGWRTHELVVLPLSEGQSAGTRVPNAEGKIDEAGSLGEASQNCGEGSGEGIEAGSTSWVSLTLKPGRYEFLCNLPNHYADGMWQEVVVTA